MMSTQLVSPSWSCCFEQATWTKIPMTVCPSARMWKPHVIFLATWHDILHASPAPQEDDVCRVVMSLLISSCSCVLSWCHTTGAAVVNAQHYQHVRYASNAGQLPTVQYFDLGMCNVATHGIWCFMVIALSRLEQPSVQLPSPTNTLLESDVFLG
jgi:hypothetical protein